MGTFDAISARETVAEDAPLVQGCITIPRNGVQSVGAGSVRILSALKSRLRFVLDVAYRRQRTHVLNTVNAAALKNQVDEMVSSRAIMITRQVYLEAGCVTHVILDWVNWATTWPVWHLPQST